MNLSAIDTFLAIVETGSLVAASHKMNVTQSTITARLKALEDSLGQKLFIRYKAGAELTAPGLRFKRYADVMTGLWHQARQETALPQDVSGLCNFGCHADLWDGMGRQFFDTIKQVQPELALSAWPGRHEEMQQWLASGVVDIALGYQPVISAKCRSEKLYDETLILYSTKKNSPARFDPGYVYVDLGEDFGKAHAISYSDADTARISFGSAAWALDYMLQHGGSAYLPKHLANDHFKNGVLHIVAEAPSFSRPVYLQTNEETVGLWHWLPELVKRVLLLID